VILIFSSASRAPCRTSPDDLAAPLPLGWEHLNITGDHRWEDQTRPDPDGFRPLVMRD
jgi:hypothetical protein